MEKYFQWLEKKESVKGTLFGESAHHLAATVKNYTAIRI